MLTSRDAFLTIVDKVNEKEEEEAVVLEEEEEEVIVEEEEEEVFNSHWNWC